MKSFKLSILLLCLMSLFLSADFRREEFPDVLNIKNVPVAAKDWKSFFFADKGSWFAYALPDKPEYFGSFAGPFILTHGRWLSRSLAGIKIYRDGKPVKLTSTDKVKIVYYPGKLYQKFVSGDLTITSELIIVSESSSLTRVTVKNTGKNSLSINALWSGDLLLKGAAFSREGNGVRVETAKSGVGISLNFLNRGDLKIDSKYSYKTLPLKLEEEKSTVFVCSQTIDVEKKPGKRFELKKENIQKAFRSNKLRWNRYLNSILNVNSSWQKDISYRRIAVKCLMTLVNNWRSPRGDIFHHGVTPSSAVSYFSTGLWGWDSWKHSVALVHFEPELAKEQIRVMFDYQDDKGFIADCIYPDKKENNWLNTKPPLIGWSAWKVYEKTGDKAFLKEVAGKIVKFHKWWYSFRDHDGNGLCEYGATADKVVGAKWESGMDDGLRFDRGIMVKNGEKAWSINQESIDLNSYLYMDKIYLSKILTVLGDKSEAEKYLKEAETLKKKIQTEMFDKKSGFFYDLRLKDKSFVKVMGPEGWIPLWAGVATDAQAKMVMQNIMDENRFYTKVPFPTIPKNNKKFMTGYWRGPVWLDQAYFGVKALQNYGYSKEAAKLTGMLFDNPEGLKDSDMPIRENYNPVNGKGMKVNHFSWSSAHLLLLFMGL